MTTDKIKNVLKKISLVFFVASIALTGCGPDDEENEPNIETGRNDEDLSDDIDSEVNEPEIPGPETNETVQDETGTEEETGHTQTESGSRPQGGTTQITSRPYKDPSLSSYWTKLENTARAGQNYYSEYYTKTRVITQNGYLYNYAAGTQITTDYLIGEGRLSSTATSSGISIMLMYGRDIASCGGSSVYIASTDREFTVFAFTEVNNKYLFASANGSYGNMSDSAYNSLMAMYSMSHGTVRRLTPSNSEYDRILSCIKMYESKYEDYFVRSITIDDKYAFVVLSGRSNAATIREYILRYDNGIWEVVMDDLESEGRLPVIVNKTLPDFNMSMLPSYSIKDFTMLTDYTAVMDALTRAGYYEKDDTFYYFCGTEDFCYMITDSGKRFLCHNNNGTWECYRVLDYYEALSRLQRLSSNPPTFILLDLE